MAMSDRGFREQYIDAVGAYNLGTDLGELATLTAVAVVAEDWSSVAPS